MKALKFILFLLLFLLLAGSSYVAVQPNSYDLSRTRTISAPVSVIYNTVEDFRQWEPWSPWKEKEPTLYLKYPEKTAGVGGSYSWIGKDGKGTMNCRWTGHHARGCSDSLQPVGQPQGTQICCGCRSAD